MSIPLALSPVGYDTWVTQLRRALITYLGSFDLVVDYLPNEKKLVVHTNQITEDLYNGIPAIVDAYIPAGVVLEQYNHSIDIPWRDWQVGYTQLSFLESDDRLYINTGIKATGTTRVEIKSTVLGIPTHQQSFFGAGPTSGGSGINPNSFSVLYGYKLNSVSYWWQCEYGTQSKSNFKYTVLGETYHVILGPEEVQNADGSKTITQTLTANGSKLVTFEQVDFETLSNIFLGVWYYTWQAGWMLNQQRIYMFKISNAGTPQADYIPCVDPSGRTCFYDLVTKTAKYRATYNGRGEYIAGIDSLGELSNLVLNLPTSAGTITLSLPDTFETDAAAQAAIAAIEAKGWVLTKNYRTDETT